MAATPSTMLDLGTIIPDFELSDSRGNRFTPQQLAASKGLIVAFICNHCPYVLHILPAFVALSKELAKKGIQTVAISSNDVNAYPQDAPDKMAQLAKEFDFNFPYLFDESQSVAKAFKAACTPDLYLFDANLSLVYRGKFDETRPGLGTAHGADLSEAATNLIEGKPPTENQQPSIGCNIKWKPDNAPEYFGA